MEQPVLTEAQNRFLDDLIRNCKPTENSTREAIKNFKEFGNFKELFNILMKIKNDHECNLVQLNKDLEFKRSELLKANDLEIKKQFYQTELKSLNEDLVKLDLVKKNYLEIKKRDKGSKDELERLINHKKELEQNLKTEEALKIANQLKILKFKYDLEIKLINFSKILDLDLDIESFELNQLLESLEKKLVQIYQKKLDSTSN